MEAPSEPADSTRKSGPWWLLPLGLLALGMTMAAWGCTTMVQSVLPLLTDDPVSVSEPIDRDLDTGTWAVYTDTIFGPGAILENMITVTAPNGAPVSLRGQSSGVSQTVSRGDGVFAVVAKFEVDTPGVHRIAVRDADQATGQMIIGRPVFESIGDSRRTLPLLVGGLFLTVAGMVLWYRRTRTSS